MKISRYISTKPLQLRDTVGKFVLQRRAARFMCVIAKGFAYYLGERTHI
jgi:hypothetical protein